MSPLLLQRLSALPQMTISVNLDLLRGLPEGRWTVGAPCDARWLLIRVFGENRERMEAAVLDILLHGHHQTTNASRLVLV